MCNFNFVASEVRNGTCRRTAYTAQRKCDAQRDMCLCNDIIASDNAMA